jgi:hypothetical protein
MSLSSKIWNAILLIRRLIGIVILTAVEFILLLVLFVPMHINLMSVLSFVILILGIVQTIRFLKPNISKSALFFSSIMGLLIFCFSIISLIVSFGAESQNFYLLIILFLFGMGTRLIHNCLMELIPKIGNIIKNRPIIASDALSKLDTPAPKKLMNHAISKKKKVDIKQKLIFEQPLNDIFEEESNSQEPFILAKPIGNNIMKDNNDKPLFHKIDLQAEDDNKDDSPIPKMAIRPFKRETQKHQPPKNGFVALARKYVDQTVKFAKHEPFSLERPTYHAMSREQGRWYFYWRSQVRQGKYLRTDLSYIMLHIYEVIHLVGFKNPNDAFKHLNNLWRNYRNQYPRLDDFLVDWLADFLIIYTNQDVMKWYSYVIRQKVSLTNPDLYIEAWLFDNRDDISKMPDSILNRISDYQYETSDFYRQSLEQHAIRRSLKQSLDLVNEFFKEHYRQTIFTYYREIRTVYSVERQPFDGAIYEGNNSAIKIVDVSRWVQSINLRRSVALILRYAENRVRQQHGYHELLSDTNIPLQWASILDRAFPIIDIQDVIGIVSEPENIPEIQPVVELEPEPETGIQLGIDYSRVAAIMAEADRLRDALSSVDSEDQAEIAQPNNVFDDALSAEEEQPLVTSAISQRESFSTDFQEVIQIINRHRDSYHLWGLLYKKNWSLSTLEAKSVVNANSFLSSIVDDINDDALNYLGDKLIFVEGDNLIVNEEYHDELTRYFKSIFGNDAETSNLVEQKPAYIVDSTGFDTNRPVDTPSHLLTDLKEVAEIIQNHPDTGRLLQGLRANNWSLPVKIAESQFLKGQFLSGIVDDLNSDALDLLEDKLLFEEDQMLIVNEEYQDELDYLLAQTSIQVEIDVSNTGIFIEDKIETNPYGILPAQLGVFAEMLSDVHWQALEIILSSDSIIRDLNHLAKRYYSTYDVIIDDINNHAIDCWGYSLIELKNPPTINEEELEDVQLLMNWALDNQIF